MNSTCLSQHVKREDGLSTAPRSLFDRGPALSKIRRTADHNRKSASTAAAAAAAAAAFGQRPLPSPVVGINTPSPLASLKHPLPRLQVSHGLTKEGWLFSLYRVGRQLSDIIFVCAWVAGGNLAERLRMV